MTGRDFALLFSFCSFFFMLATMVLSGVARRRKDAALDHRRIDLLEKALQHPSLDDATRTELLQVLAHGGGRPHPPPVAEATRRGDWWHLLWFGPGWVLFVVGGCMLGAHALSLAPGVDLKTFLPMTITGFAVLTLPMALRELRVRRDHPAPSHR